MGDPATVASTPATPSPMTACASPAGQRQRSHDIVAARAGRETGQLDGDEGVPAPSTPARLAAGLNVCWGHGRPPR